MGWYAKYAMPYIIGKGMDNKAIREHRPKVPPLATGRVLEVGVGSGLNIPYYKPEAIDHLFGLEPSPELVEQARERAEAASFPVEFITAGAEAIPLEANSVDTVVSTWTLCSIPDIEISLQEMRRVLKPGGRLMFIEHGRAPDAGVAKWQDRLAPLFRGLAGCNPNRQIDALIGEAGFEFADLSKDYFDGPRFISYHYVGQATPRA